MSSLLSYSSDLLRVVLDTNIVISAFLDPTSKASQAFDKAQRTSTLLASNVTMEELTEVLSRKKFDRYLSRTRRANLLAEYLQAVELVEIVQEIRACRDPKDDKFLSLAVSGGADLVLSGDADLLSLHPFQGFLFCLLPITWPSDETFSSRDKLNRYVPTPV